MFGTVLSQKSRPMEFKTHDNRRLVDAVAAGGMRAPQKRRPMTRSTATPSRPRRHLRSCGDGRVGVAWRRIEPPDRPDPSSVSGALAAAVPFLAAEPVHERPERPRVSRWRVAPLLSVAARRRHRLGPRRQQGPAALAEPTGRDPATADGKSIFSGSVVIDKDNTSGFGTPGNPAMVAIYTASGRRQPVPGARLQSRQGAHVHLLLREPGHRHRVEPVPRPEGVLARARRSAG